MAESSVITCPECTKRFKGKGDLEGRKIKCPFCSKVFVVAPGATKTATAKTTQKAPAPAQAPAPPIAMAPASSADDDENDPNPYGLTHLDIAPRCPNCANKMADEEAFICLFCGYNTLTRELGKTEKTIGHTGGERFMHLLPGIGAALGLLFFILWQMYYSLLLPQALSTGWANFFGHESLKMWHTLITLAIVWPLGFFCYKRFIVHPLPPEKKID